MDFSVYTRVRNYRSKYGWNLDANYGSKCRTLHMFPWLRALLVLTERSSYVCQIQGGGSGEGFTAPSAIFIDEYRPYAQSV